MEKRIHQHITITHLNVLIRELDSTSRYSLDHRLHPWIAKFCGIAETDILDYRILHRSLDARRKPDIRYIYRLAVVVREGVPIRDDVTISFHPPEPDQNNYG